MNKAYIYLNGSICPEMVSAFISSINNIEYSSDIVIYLSSIGGEIPSYHCLLHTINDIGPRVTLIATGSIMSCAFHLFFDAEVKEKIILPYTIGMTHNSNVNVEMNAYGNVTDSVEQLWIKQMYEDNDLYHKWLKKIGLTAKELKTVKDGKECNFSTHRLKELLDGQNKNR